MRRKLLDDLHDRLENLFTDIERQPDRPSQREPTPRRPSERRQLPAGWVWEMSLNGHYSWCSPEIERLLGIEPASLVDTSLFDKPFVGPAVGELESLVNNHLPITNFKIKAEKTNGKQYTAVLHALVRNDGQGRPVGYRGVAQLIDLEPPKTSMLTIPAPHAREQVDATSAPILLPGWGSVPGYTDEGDGVRPVRTPLIEAHRESLREDKKLVIPITTGDSVLGELEFEAPIDGRNWTDLDRQLADEVGRQLGLALQDSRSYQLTQQALDEMREADQLKSQFLANMSHELRTPLNSIIGFSKVILKGIDGPVTDTQREDLNAIYNAGQHLLGLISDMLDISRIEAGKLDLTFDEVDLIEVIDGVLSTAVGLVKDKPIELVTDIPEDLPTIQADRIRIRQVLLNLISNAAKFTEEGQIAVSARFLQTGTEPELLVAVADTGIGIARDDVDKLFEPFSQVDPSPTRKSGGSGLGLSIARHLVELHGGRIWVESTVGEGSTFVFTLPLAPPTAPPQPFPEEDEIDD
ncbi:MAG: ATP-binding protein [Anaerolineales bacterium]